jgi:hypothetical protein
MAFGGLPVTLDLKDWNRTAIFGDYQKNAWRFSAEWRREEVSTVLAQLGTPGTYIDSRAWFVAGSYRVNKYFEVGTYYNSYVTNTELSASDDNNHVSGPVVSGRFDINRFWNVKVEGHFMDGYGNPAYSHGFYSRNNPAGALDANTTMLVVRTGFNF